MPYRKHIIIRAYSSFAPSQWKTVLLCYDVSHWLGASQESAPIFHISVKWVQARPFVNGGESSCSSHCITNSTDCINEQCAILEHEYQQLQVWGTWNNLTDFERVYPSLNVTNCLLYHVRRNLKILWKSVFVMLLKFDWLTAVTT